jgi:nucleoside-diphosphate-sugar epimerase
MHILVTGGCGYIGSVLIPKLLKAGNDITVVDIMWFGNHLPKSNRVKTIQEDIRNTASVPMDGIDAIIHLANIANDPCGDLNAKLSWEVNVLATMTMVEHAIKHKIKQFLYASSGSVYGVKEEPQVTEDLPLVPISDYNKTKMISERVLMSYKDYITMQCIRPATVCGYSPRMRLDLSVNMLTMQALVNGRITVFGGDQTRPNIHIQDITDVFTHFLMLGDKAPGIYNAGFENISILNIAKKVVELIPAEIVIMDSNDPRSYRLNSERLMSTGFKQNHSVSDAIQEIVDAYHNGKLKDEYLWYNLKAMKKIKDL